MDNEIKKTCENCKHRFDGFKLKKTDGSDIIELEKIEDGYICGNLAEVNTVVKWVGDYKNHVCPVWAEIEKIEDEEESE